MSADEKLTEIFRSVFMDDTIELRDDLSASDRSDWDSMVNINLMFAIEEAFRIQLSGSEFTSLQNVGELRRLLTAKLGHAV